MLNRGNHGFAHVIWSLCTAQTEKGMEGNTAGAFPAGDRMGQKVPPSLPAPGCAGPTCTVKICQLHFLKTDQLRTFSSPSFEE